MPSNMFVVSSVRRPRKEVATVLRVDQTLAERKCRMTLESIRNGYRCGRNRKQVMITRKKSKEPEEGLNISSISLTFANGYRIAACYRLDSKSLFSQLDQLVYTVRSQPFNPTGKPLYVKILSVPPSGSRILWVRNDQ